MFFKYNLTGILWGVLISFLSLIPGRDLPSVDIVNLDKIVHLGIYAVWVFLLMIGFNKQYAYCKIRYNSAKIAVIGCSLYGIILEVLQELFFEERFFDLYDVAANTAGCLLGTLVFTLVYIKL